MPTPSVSGLTLKQRLASLSTSLPGAASTSLPKRRTFFGAPTRTRTVDPYYSQDSIHDVMSKLIFQAGVDYETRPMVVMNASALPDSREVNYDELLARILSYLDLYVESDYTVVFFAAGGRHTPSWNWVWKAYRSLNRKYRKNLKKLFIVHSSFFTKMLFSLAGTIISPKFFRKITYINTLSELAVQVPLTQIDIPPAVYQENLKYEQQITLPIGSSSRAELFGVPLEELMGFDGENGGLPRVVKDCVQYLRQTGLQEEGLFRRSPNSAMLKQAQQAYDRGHVVSLATFGDPHLAAVLLKKYLRDLPTPIFPEHLYPLISRCPLPNDDPADDASVLYIRETIMPELPHCTYVLLSHVLQLLHEVSLRSATNRMDAHNLAVVVSPNLVAGSNPLRDVMMCAIGSDTTASPFATQLPSSTATMGKNTLGMVIKLCIERYYEVFDEVYDRSEAIPERDFEAPSSQTPTQTTPPRSRADSHRPSPPPLPSRHYDLAPSASFASFASASSPASPTARETLSARLARTAGKPGSTFGAPYGTVNKARSTISIDRGDRAALRKGSISVGRGTGAGARKSSGAAVEAVGITAAGFFAPPEDAPPVPPLLPSQVKANGGRLPVA